MNCRIELINPRTNKTIKSAIVSGSYAECENEVIKLNDKIKNGNFWKVTEINI